MSRGIYKITLYEGKNFFIRYSENGTIGQIQTSGDTYIFDSCYFPQLTTEIVRENGQRLYNREINLQLRTKAEYSKFINILKNYHGWYALIEKMDGTQVIVLDPFVSEGSNQNYSAGVNYSLSLQHYELSDNKEVVFVDTSFLTVDQTDITVDSTLITVDQTTE